MNKLIPTSMKTEKLAAYLDGNVNDSELRTMSNIIRNHPGLKEIVDVCDEVDADMEAFASQGLEIPEEIKNPNLTLPDLSRFNTPWREIGLVASVAMCADFAMSDDEDDDSLS